MPQDYPEIFVVAARYNSVFVVTEFFVGWTGGGHVPPLPSDDPDQLPPDYIGEVRLLASYTNPANRDRVILAAKRLAEAIVRTRGALLAADPNAKVKVGRKTLIVSVALADLANTDFTVTDEAVFGNAGVGSARRSTDGGRHSDVINFEAIIGNGAGGPGYAIGYTNAEGMNALILHELAHLSSAGYDFFVESRNEHASAVARGEYQGPFYPSKYSENLEKFANDLMIGLANVLGMDIMVSDGAGGQRPVLPGGGQGSVEPGSL